MEGLMPLFMRLKEVKKQNYIWYIIDYQKEQFYINSQIVYDIFLFWKQKLGSWVKSKVASFLVLLTYMDDGLF